MVWTIMGMDKPMPVQVLNFFKGLFLKGDLGTSRIYRNNVPVTEILGPSLPFRSNSARLRCSLQCSSVFRWAR